MDRRLLPALTALLVACGGGGGDDGGSMTGPDPEPATGTLEVAASTTGERMPSSFGVEVDGSQEGTVEPNGRTTISGLETGSHQVGLQLPGSCESEGANPKTVSVSAESTASASFSVSCQESWVVYAKADDGQKSDIWRARPDGSEKMQLTDVSSDERYPHLSPNRESVVFDRSDVFIVNMDGSRLENLTNTLNNRNQSLQVARYPSWSSDGQRIIFVCAFRGEETGGILCEMNPDGSGIQRLMNVSELLDCNGVTCGVRHPIYSPDGQRIAFQIHESGVPGLYIVNRDGTGLRQLVDGVADYPKWGPEGEWIYYSRSVGTSASSQRVNLHGNTEPLRSMTSSPAPSPNGEWVIVREATFQGEAQIISVPNGEETRPTSITGGGFFDWQ